MKLWCGAAMPCGSCAECGEVLGVVNDLAAVYTPSCYILADT